MWDHEGCSKMAFEQHLGVSTVFTVRFVKGRNIIQTVASRQKDTVAGREGGPPQDGFWCFCQLLSHQLEPKEQYLVAKLQAREC